MCVRITHCVANLAEEAEPRLQIGGVVAAPDIDRLTIDILHRHVRTLVGRDATVDQAGDARMLKTRKEPALAIEELRQSSCLRAQHLERNALLEALAFPVRGIHLAHTTASDQAIDYENTYKGARRERAIGWRLVRQLDRWWNQVEHAPVSAGRQEGLQLSRNRRVQPRVSHPRSLLGGREVNQLVENEPGFRPIVLGDRGHCNKAFSARERS